MRDRQNAYPWHPARVLSCRSRYGQALSGTEDILALLPQGYSASVRTARGPNREYPRVARRQGDWPQVCSPPPVRANHCQEQPPQELRWPWQFLLREARIQEPSDLPTSIQSTSAIRAGLLSPSISNVHCSLSSIRPLFCGSAESKFVCRRTRAPDFTGAMKRTLS